MLSLKTRPKILAEIKYQHRIIRELKNRSRNIDFPYYMLFLGDSGTGKTSTAFIISKIINCNSPVLNNEGYYDPCNQCPACIDVTTERFGRNVYYMDASKMGKEEVRKLRRITWTAPFPYTDNQKVFIIDEAHLLNSPAAHGAMLTILEDGQLNRRWHHTIILCTTNDKFSEALKSRLIQYDFKRIDVDTIMAHLTELIHKEQIHVPVEFKQEFFYKVLKLLAIHSDGNLRKAIQDLERCLYGEIWSLEEAEEEFDMTLAGGIDNSHRAILDHYLEKSK